MSTKKYKPEQIVAGIGAALTVAMKYVAAKLGFHL